MKKISYTNKQKNLEIGKIKIREITFSDLEKAEEFLNFFNSLIEEEAMICLNRKKTLEEEKEWLKRVLESIDKKEKVMLVAEDNNKIVGISEVTLEKGRKNHIAVFAISVRKEYRGIGLGEKLMSQVLELAEKKLKPKTFYLSVFANNKIAINLYKKLGFKKVAKIPKQLQYKGKLIDEIIMIKELM